MYEKVVSIVADQLGIDPATITPESALVEDLKADSIDIVALIMDLESEYGLEVSDEQIAKLRTVSDIVTFLEGNV